MSPELSSLLRWALNMLGESVVVGALLTGAAFLFRSQITQFLNKDIERLKHQHQLQLEAYKVSLIAEVEKTKAQQDIKKQAALKVIEKKFNAFNNLHEASLGNAVDFSVAAGITDPVQNLKARQECLARAEKLRSAIHSAEIFLELEEKRTLLELQSAMASFLPKIAAAAKNAPVSEADLNAERALLLGKELAVDALIRRKIEEMMAAA